MSIRSRILCAAILLAATAFLPACYTIFVHPRLAQLNYKRPDDRNCGACHNAQELWDFTHPATIPPMVGPWGEFYEQPWWFERHWKPGVRPESTDSIPPAKEGG